MKLNIFNRSLYCQEKVLILMRWMNGQSGTIAKQINSVHNEMHTLMHFYLQCNWLVKTWCHKFRWNFVSTKHTKFPFDLFEDKLFIYLFWNMNATFALRNFTSPRLLYYLSASFNSPLIIDFSSGSLMHRTDWSTWTPILSICC